jgi:glycosyltransferase involved in cell wall biosynthesis
VKTVLYTTPFADIFGGGQESLLVLLGALDRAKYRPLLAVPAEGEVARRARELGCEVRVLDLPAVRSGLSAVKACLAFRRLLQSDGVDLIHTDGPRSTFYAVWARGGLAIPLVWHIRNDEKDGLLDRYLEGRVDRIILVAKVLEARFSKRTRARCVAIHNGIDLSAIKHETPEGLPPHQPPLLVCPGRLDGGHKGQDVLLEALPRVRERANASVWFIGDEQKDYGLKLRARAKALGLSDCVHFLGFRKDARALMALCDVVVLPSLHEGFPRVLLEAMAEGKPVVASKVGGIPELVEDGETGFLVPPSDPQSLAAALREILSAPSLMKRMGEAGRVRVAGFSSQAMARAVERVYEEALAAIS